jgi:hypothetical protein
MQARFCGHARRGRNDTALNGCDEIATLLLHAAKHGVSCRR